MDAILTTSSFGSDPQQLPLPAKDSDLELSSDELAPGSGSSSSETEQLGSELKRRKKEEPDGDDESSSDEVSEDKKGFVQVMLEPLIFYPKDAEGVEKLKRFYQQVEESEGFDFDEFPPVNCISRGVYPVDLKSEWYRNVKACVDHVIEQHNSLDNGVLKLKLDKIVKANKRSAAGINFYITFEATNELSSDPQDARKVYQAHVYQDIIPGKFETELFRVKGETEIIRGEERREVRALTYAGYPI